mmetsp:Transcript_12761/g.28242  ORF Transcript_12761/g.28242 Transcript_12761/m.28242 type:complete len:406 (-) Transcript_12761:99-1316(-)
MIATMRPPIVFSFCAAAACSLLLRHVVTFMIVFHTTTRTRPSMGCQHFDGISTFPSGAAGPSSTVLRSRSQSPMIALLLSFPNSGTSFTLRLIRETSSTTTATNYAKETREAKLENYSGTIPSIYDGCSNCPLLHDSELAMPTEYVLVKTHCEGYTGQMKNGSSLVYNQSAFLEGCLTPYSFAAHRGRDGRIKQTRECPYAPTLVKKVVHIMRDPMDNIVSRFHLWKKNYDIQQRLLAFNSSNDEEYSTTDEFPRSKQGFKDWCRVKDQELMASKELEILLDFSDVPCMSEYYLYTQWHNNAFHTTSGGISTHFFYYEQYETAFNETASALINFLHTDRKYQATPFVSGKNYDEYYTEKEMIAIWHLIEHFASEATWTKLQRYYSTDDDENDDATRIVAGTSKIK